MARGADIWAELSGYGLTSDAFHATVPLGVGYVNAHGTSTTLNDRTEAHAIRTVLGDQVPVSSTKSMTGHLLGAAGALEAVATILAIRHGILPPTVNHDDPDPEIGLDVVPNQAREHRVRVALSNSFGFGGHNATLVFRAV